MVGCQGFVLCHLVAAYIACTVLYYIVVPWEQQGVVLHENFSLQQYTHIKEYDCHCALYRHIPTGAQVISVRAQDTNKVFGIAFRTPPPDSTGVAHVLEHSVLCGSEKYKTKEPFVDLLRGSLQTFLNAMTWPDRTVYPVASQNVKDLYNLADVYVDVRVREHKCVWVKSLFNNCCIYLCSRLCFTHALLTMSMFSSKKAGITS